VCKTAGSPWLTIYNNLTQSGQSYYDFVVTVAVLVSIQTGERVRQLAMRFPRLLTECTVSWFHGWSTEAFVDVATHEMADFDVDCESEVKRDLCSNLASAHQQAVDMSAVYRQRYHVFTGTRPRVGHSRGCT